MADLKFTLPEPNSQLSDSVPSTNYEEMVAENQRILKEAEEAYQESALSKSATYEELVAEAEKAYQEAREESLKTSQEEKSDSE